MPDRIPLEAPPGGWKVAHVSLGDAPGVEELFGHTELASFRLVERVSPDRAPEEIERVGADAVLVSIGANGAAEGAAVVAAIRQSRRDVPIVILTPDPTTYFDLAIGTRETDGYVVADGLTAGVLRQALALTVERTRTLAALRYSQERYKRFYENSAVAIFELDLEGGLLSANPAMVELFGYASEAELLAASDDNRHFVNPRDREEWFNLLRRRRKLVKYRKSMRTRSGRRLELLDTTYLVHDARGNPIGYQGSVIDFTEVHELSEQLSYEASHDSLTRLPNRRAIEQHLQQILEAAQTDGSVHALCYVDLDQFKVINDTFGHSAGDELLRQLGGTLGADLSSRDTLARLGGDEFALLMRDRTLEEAARTAENLLDAIRRFRFRWGDRDLDVGASIGVVPIDGNTVSLSELLGAADAACYTAKEKGRNRVHVQEPDDKTISRRISEMRLVVEAKHALQENRMQLFQQPIRALPLTGADQIRFEILIRMLGWDGELVSPGLFLPAIEKYNLSRTVDCWVIERFLAWMAQSPTVLAKLAYGSINISGLSLGDPNFLTLICAQLDEREVRGDQICFEITETAAIQNLSAAQKFIAALRTRGCRFALDDFGSGTSSFGYLRNLPVDAVKIDGMFVRTLRHSETDRVIVKSINDVAHSMGLLTIAESVEDAETLKILTDLGVNFAQGYAVGRPRPLPIREPPIGAVAPASAAG